MSAWRSAAVAAALAAVVGCSEKLSTPGKCPSLCPSSNVQLADTLLTTADVSDTSVRGYVLVREASYLLASTLDSLRSVILVQFDKLDTVWYPGSDTAYSGIQDSVLLSFHINQRDTAVKQLRLLVYRLPGHLDTAATYASIQPYFADSQLVDTIPIPDTLQAGDTLSAKIADSLPIPAADSGLVSLGFAIVAAGKTALTLGSGNLSTVAPSLTYFVEARAPLDSLRHSFALSPNPGLFVMSPDPSQPTVGVITLGGIPTARALVRLSLPKVVLDSNAVVRATLLLTTTGPVGGFAGDSFYVIAEPIVRDFGVKSVLWPDSAVSGLVKVAQGQTGPVGVDIAPILRFWGTTVGDSTPRVLMLRAYPEGSIIGEARFFGRAGGANGPQLRVTYVKPYSFGLP